MATKKTKPSQVESQSETEGDGHKPVSAKELSAEEALLLEQARAILVGIRHKMQAVVRAASEQWQPALDPHQVDETSAPYLSDEEFDDITNVTELMAEMAFLREFGLFFGMPQNIVDSVVQERLKAKLIPHGHPKAPIAFVAKKKSREAQ